MAGNTFGRRIRKLRKRSGVSLRKFADQMGLSAAYLSRIETGKFPPPAEDKIIAMAEALEADTDELLALAGKVSSDIVERIVENPSWLPALIRLLADRLAADQKQLLASGPDELYVPVVSPRGELVIRQASGAGLLDHPVPPHGQDGLDAGPEEMEETEEEEEAATVAAHRDTLDPGQQDLFSQLEG